jgi:arylsulfatase A-like enzyme
MIRKILHHLVFIAISMAIVSPVYSQADKPNIILIVADDLGRQDCGFMGGKEIKTPHLDRLASAGAILDAHYVQPVCSPTRAAFMTGRYPMRHGLQVGVVRPWAQYGLPLDEQTMAEMLKAAGYQTAISGKWHLGHFQPGYLPTRRGFDHQYGHYNGAIDYFTHIRDGGFDWHRDDKVSRDEGYSTELLGRFGAEFVAANAGKEPFFLYVPFNGVHSPHQAPEKYIQMYPELKGVRKTYAGMLTALDDAVGRIVKSVEDAGMMNKTLFIFSSDNGGPEPGKVTDNGPYRAGKATLYEGGVRVAAFVTWKGRIKPGNKITEPIHAVDWYPTLARLTGSSLKQKLATDGMDVWPVIDQGARSPHDFILLNTTPNSGAIRRGEWKLVVKTGDDDPDGAAIARKKANRQASVELFHLLNDPYEKQNLAEKEPKIVAELKSKLDEYARQAVAPKVKPKAAGFKSPAIWGEF